MKETFSNIKNKRGIAIVSVIMLCTVLITMLSFLFYNTRIKRNTQEFQYDTTRALIAANTAMQLAIYKYRVLSSEYYRINDLEIDLRSRNQSLDAPDLVKGKTIWLSDLHTKQSFDSVDNEANEYNSTAVKIKQYFNDFASENKEYDFGVSSFELVSLEKNGYTKDYIKIKAWGSYNKVRKDVEELIEVSVVK